MPNFSSASVLGKFFGLDLTLNYSEQKGYLHSEAKRFRLFPGQTIDQKADALLVRLDSTSQDPKNQISTIITPKEDPYSPVELLQKGFGDSVCIIELNFDKCQLYLENEVRKVSYNFAKLFEAQTYSKLSAHKKFEKEQLYNHIYVCPVIPDDVQDELINLQILVSILQDGLVEVEVQNTVILTGEMIWSGWLSFNAIVYLLNILWKQTISAHIDVTGIWQLLAHSFDSHSSILELNQGYFSANLTYIGFQEVQELRRPNKDVVELVKNGQHRKLIIDETKNGLFDLGENGYETKVGAKMLGRYLCLDLNNAPDVLFAKSFDKFLTWRKNINLMLPEIKINPWVRVTFGKLNFTVNHLSETDCVKGDQLQAGQSIGLYSNQETSYIDCRNLDLNSVDLIKLDGEIVRKGEEIFTKKNLGLLRALPKANATGSLDLSLLKLTGFIIIRKKLAAKEYKLDFDAQVLQVFHRSNRLNMELEASGYNIDTYRQIGKNVSGRLSINEIMEGNNNDNILLLENFESAKLDINFLAANHVSAVIVSRINYQEMLNLLNSTAAKLGDVTIVLLNGLSTGSEIDKHHVDLLSFFKKMAGRFISVENNFLKVPTIQGKFNLDSEQVRSNMALKKGDKIEIISYTGDNLFTIEKIVDNNKVLVAAHDDFVEKDKANIFIRKIFSWHNE